MHRDYLQPFMRSGIYPPDFVPTPKFFSRMDEAASHMVNADDGGTYAPSSPIVLGQQSFASAALVLNTTGSILSGGVQTGRLGNLKCNNADAPKFASNRSRTVVAHFSHAGGNFQAGTEIDIDPVYGCPRFQQSALASLIVPPIRWHQGATLTRVDIYLRIAKRRPTLPANQPVVRIYALPTGVQLRASFVQMAAATPDAYFNGGNAQVLSYAPTQNNVLDTTTNAYMIQVTDEAGANSIAPSLNLVHSAVFVYTASIADMRPE